jgi:GAF domain-containing protein
MMMTEDEQTLTNSEDNVSKDNVTRDSILVWRQQLIRRVLQVMTVFGFLMVAAGSYSAYARGALWAVGAYVGVYVVLVILAVWQKAPYTLQVGGIQLLLYTVAFVVFLTRGVGDSSRLYLLAMIFVSGLFWGWRISLITLALSILTMIGLGWAFTAGLVTGYEEVISTDLSAWVALTIDLLSMSVFIAVLLHYFSSRFDTYVSQSRKLARQLEDNQAELEARVAERTATLAERSMQLEAAAQVAREAAEIQDVEQLLERTVRLVSDRFGFYHTGIFLLDEAGEYAVLQATSSPGGQRMLAREHRLRLGEMSIVGYVASRGEPRIASDVGEDAVYFDNPDMPETRSEMALPLRVRGTVIGVLDVQSVESEAFTQENVGVLQTLADQLAVAVENARLLSESQVALQAARRAYGEVSRESWEELSRARTDLQARYDPNAVLSSDGGWREEMKVAVREGKSISDADERPDTVAVPIKVRNQVIGVLDAHKPKDGAPWTVDEIGLLETLTEQLGVALESARLHEDTQRRAVRERLTAEVTTRIRESLDIDTMLRTAIREMGERLNIAEVEVWMSSEE